MKASFDSYALKQTKTKDVITLALYDSRYRGTQKLKVREKNR